MKTRHALICCAALAFACAFETPASAAGRLFGGMATPTTILPSRQEIRAVPAPGQGRMIRYGLTVHPGARTARMILAR